MFLLFSLKNSLHIKADTETNYFQKCSWCKAEIFCHRSVCFWSSTSVSCLCVQRFLYSSCFRRFFLSPLKSCGRQTRAGRRWSVAVWSRSPGRFGAAEAFWAPARRTAPPRRREKRRPTPRSDRVHPSAWPEKRTNEDGVNLKNIKCLPGKRKL